MNYQQQSQAQHKQYDTHPIKEIKANASQGMIN